MASLTFPRGNAQDQEHDRPAPPREMNNQSDELPIVTVWVSFNFVSMKNVASASKANESGSCAGAGYALDRRCCASQRYSVILLQMSEASNPEFNAIDLIHWDVCFALRKLREQAASGTYKRLLINSDRPFLNVSGTTSYLEAVAIANPARLRDLIDKSNAVIELNNNEFDALENTSSNGKVSYNLATASGGLLSINCEIECLYIRGKEVLYAIATRKNFEDFSLNNSFAIYSSQEFARNCAALHNVVTAFYSENELRRSEKKQSQSSIMQATNPLTEKEQHFLATLYHKTKSNPEAGADPVNIGQAVCLPPGELSTFQYQLQESGFIKQITGSRQVCLTGAAMRMALAALKDYQATIITILNGHAIPIESKMLYRYIYFYRLSTQASTDPYKSITVGISDFVQMYDWKLSFAAGGSAESVLLLHARDKLMLDIQTGVPSDEQTVEIMQKDLPSLPKYSPSDAPVMKGAEFYVYKRIRQPLPTIPTHRSVPDLIVETRKMINLVFKKKHNEYLLELAQEENLTDLFKDAHTKEEFNTRLISLGSTVGEMNVDLLRTLTGITDTQIRSIQLLKALLIPLALTAGAHIKTLQNLAIVRNGYPAHQDKPDTLKAYNDLGIPYPVTDYSVSWKALLVHYLTALQGINNGIQNKYL